MARLNKQQNKVLIVGDEGLADPAHFLSHLIDTEKDTEEQGGKDGVIPWTITTKYYTAELALHLAETDAALPWQKEARALAEGEGAGEEGEFPLSVHEDLQGLILVYDAGSSTWTEEDKEPSETFQAWLKAASTRETLALCLIVAILPEGSSSSSSHNLKQRYDEDDQEDGSLKRHRTLWCLDHGFEYIEVDYTRPLQTLPEELREKEGMDRIRECVEATIWEHLDLHGPSNSKPSAHSMLEMGGQGNEEEEASKGPCIKETAAAAAATTTRPSTSSSPSSSSSFSCKGGRKEEEAEEEEEEEASANNDGLDELFEKIRAVRETAGQYSDPERRARAAETALLLAKTLGIEGFFNDDEEDED